MKQLLTARIPVLAGVMFLSIFCTGCANYKYFVVQPPTAGQPVAKEPMRVDLAPLSYQFFVREQRLVMQINNPTDGPISLIGPKSYLVDPQGRSHALRGGIIAPHSFIGMSLPPGSRRGGWRPSFGLGLGFGGYGPGVGLHSGVGLYEDPYFYGSPEQGPSPYYWDWKRGEVRLMLYYQQWNPTNTFEHQFVLDRRKVK